MNKPTYIITGPQIEKVFNMEDYVSTVEQAFKIYGRGEVQMPPKMYLIFPKGDLRCMPVYIPSMNIGGVKNVNVHSGNEDIPTVMATIILIDPETGYPLAVMDGTHITNMRTGAAGGIAAKYLSREDSKVAAFIGTGIQARTQLAALLVTRPNISKVKAYDTHEATKNDFINYVTNEYGLDVVGTTSVEDAVSEADIITTTTPVRTPVVNAEYIPKGTHINAIGADAEGKQELDPEILKRARVVIDNWEQASHSGEINVPLSKRIITQADIYGDIGEVVTGKKPGRESSDEITVFDSTGLAIQDISAASEIYNKLTSDKELEASLRSVNFL